MSLMERIKEAVKNNTYSNEEDALWDLAKWGMYTSQEEFDADYATIYGHPRSKSPND